MRHRKASLKLNRTPSHRKAMFRNLVTSLLKHERIRTTEAKAKELRRWADHVITLAKRGDLHARRQALAIVREKNVVHKLFEQAAERFGTISGGYTRIVKLGHRAGDAAAMSLVELVTVEPDKKKKTKKKRTKAGTAPKKSAADSKLAADEKKTKSAKAKETEVKEEGVPKKKSSAKAEDDAIKPEAKTEAKKKTAEAKTEKKSVSKTAAEKKTVGKAEKEDKPEKKAKSASSKEPAADGGKKRAPAKKTPKEKK